MILVTHAVAGAAFASLAPQNPFLAFWLSVASHFLLDMPAHWHYQIKSLERSRENPLNNKLHLNYQFLYDLVKISFDCLLGFVIIFFFAINISSKTLPILLLGGIGGVLPDFLQFIYYLYPKGFMRRIQIFHKKIHSKQSLDDKPVLGISMQIVLITISLWVIHSNYS